MTTKTGGWKIRARQRGDALGEILIGLAVIVGFSLSAAFFLSKKDQDKLGAATLSQIQTVRETIDTADVKALQQRINDATPVKGMKWALYRRAPERWIIHIQFDDEQSLCKRMARGLVPSKDEVKINEKAPSAEWGGSSCSSGLNVVTIRSHALVEAEKAAWVERKNAKARASVAQKAEGEANPVAAVEAPKPAAPVVPSVDLDVYTNEGPAKRKSWNDAGGY